MRFFFLAISFTLFFTATGFGQVTTPNIEQAKVSNKSAENLIIYGSDTCHYCIDTKAYLKEKKIDFTYYDVDINLAKQREMVTKLQKVGTPLDNISLPVVDLNGKLIMNSDDFEGFLKKLYSSKTTER